jgi:23S rRNA pseudouridine1911/1915/1917 synthase
MEKITIKISEELSGFRLDKALSLLCSDLSRSRVTQLITQGNVIGKEIITDGNYKVKTNEEYVINIPALIPSQLIKSDISLDIVFERPISN